jgi:hypothetical protein
MHQYYHFIVMVNRYSYMFRRISAIIRELTRSSQATCRCKLQKKIMEYRVKQLQLVISHYGYKWIWLTAASIILSVMYTDTKMHSSATKTADIHLTNSRINILIA